MRTVTSALCLTLPALAASWTTQPLHLSTRTPASVHKNLVVSSAFPSAGDDDSERSFLSSLSKRLAGCVVAATIAAPSAALAVSGGGLDFAGLDISGQDFSKQNYKGKDFTQGKIRFMSFGR